jgi:hypothetical protein
MVTPDPGRRKIESAEGHGASKHGFFDAFFGSALQPIGNCSKSGLFRPASHKIRPVSGRLPKNIHKKMRQKSWLRLATHTGSQQWGAKDKISIYIVNMTFSKFKPF